MANVTYSIHDLRFGYGEAEVLRGLDLTFTPGHLHAIIGPNGSGKSTLLDLMAGHRTPTAGTVQVNDIPVADLTPATLARLTALVPQSTEFNFPFTVSDAVLMGRHPHIPRFSRPTERDMQIVDNALKTLDIQHLAHRTLAELSGGERQRTVVARALAQGTPALLLDEPTSSMDIRHGLATMAELKRLAREERRTIITVLHDLNLAAAYCDHIIMLHKGTVHAQGKGQEALTPDAIRHVFGVTADVISKDDTGQLIITYTQEP